MIKKIMLSAFVLALLIIGPISVNVFPCRVQASTNVNSMIIRSDATWTKANSPHKLTGPILVGNGVILTIAAGAKVDFGGFYMQVDGTLQALGSIIDKAQLDNGEIRFTLASTDWNEQARTGCIIENSDLNNLGIEINDTSPKINSNSILNGHMHSYQGTVIISNNYVVGDSDYAIIQIDSLSPALIMNNTIIDNINSSNHVAIESSAENATISNNTIKGNGGVGLRTAAHILDNVINGFFVGIYAWYGTIEGDLIFNNTRGIEEKYEAEILLNTIAKNDIGILWPRGTISNNNLVDNKYNMYLEGSGDVDATQNWWGTNDSEAINQTIRDSKNDFTLGTVNFVPFLIAPSSNAPSITLIPSSSPSTGPSSIPTTPTSPSLNSTSLEPTEPNAQTGNKMLSELEIQEIVIATLIVIIMVLFIIIIWMQRKSRAQNQNTTKQQTA